MEKTQKVIRRLFDQYLESIESVLDLKWMKNVSVFGLKQANIHNKKKFVYRNSFSFFLTRRRSSDTEILGIFKLICSFVNVYLVRIRMDCLFNNGVWIHLSQKHLDFFSFFLQHRSNGHGCSNSFSFSLHSSTHYTQYSKHSWCHISLESGWRSKMMFLLKKKTHNTMRLDWVCLLLSGQNDTTIEVNNKIVTKCFNDRSFRMTRQISLIWSTWGKKEMFIVHLDTVIIAFSPF